VRECEGQKDNLCTCAVVCSCAGAGAGAGAGACAGVCVRVGGKLESVLV